MSGNKDGSFVQVQAGFGHYIERWFHGCYGDTKAVQEFLARPFMRSVKWAPSRMVDEAEKMLSAYMKNENGPNGQTTTFPVVLMAMDENFLGTGADWGGDQIARKVLQIEEGGSWYGYQHRMMDRRVQLVIVANEGGTAQSLAAQLSRFVKQPKNRYFDAIYTFGEYMVPMPVTLETNRIDWMDIKLPDGSKNFKMLAADFTLKCTTPHFDAPAPGEPNDGSTKTPPGYPALSVAEHVDSVSGTKSTGTTGGIEWGRSQ